jgi:hypothetical protein
MAETLAVSNKNAQLAVYLDNNGQFIAIEKLSDNVREILPLPMLDSLSTLQGASIMRIEASKGGKSFGVCCGPFGCQPCPFSVIGGITKVFEGVMKILEGVLEIIKAVFQWVQGLFARRTDDQQPT